jgi:hypothetical protein
LIRIWLNTEDMPINLTNRRRLRRGNLIKVAAFD